MAREARESRNVRCHKFIEFVLVKLGEASAESNPRIVDEDVEVHSMPRKQRVELCGNIVLANVQCLTDHSRAWIGVAQRLGGVCKHID